LEKWKEFLLEDMEIMIRNNSITEKHWPNNTTC
jgi:hypothetical protein